MFTYEEKVPLTILQLEALIRRLHPNHNKIPAIKDDYNNRLSGYRGEKSLQYYLSFLPKNYKIFYGLRLPDSEGRYFQMDILMVTPKYNVICEVKNHKGTLIFDQNVNQLIQDFNGKQMAYSDPIVQVLRQRIQFHSFLTKHKLPIAPTEILVIVSNPHTIIKMEPSNHPNANNIIRTESIPIKTEKFEVKYKKDLLTPTQIGKMARYFKKFHKPLQTNILQQYQISESEILPGVHCPECLTLSMKRSKGYWICHSCNYQSKDAHMDTLKDFALLFNRSITNKECRQFLQISSIKIATTILISLEVNQTGGKKNRAYDLMDLLK
jgi:ribosomal protein L37AE/L43A